MAIINELLRAFSYAFTLRALIVGVMVSLCAALLGVSLVLKRYSMIGDGLSHVGFGALAVAAAANIAPLPVALAVVIVAAFILMRINDTSRISGDAAIALISSGALAIGVIVVSLSGMNTDLNSYMFGSILTLTNADTVLSVILCVAVISTFILCYNRIFAITFDETFAQATGTKAKLFTTLLSVLTAVTIVLGMRMMGALLISSLIIFPCLSAMYVFKTYRAVTIASAVISVCAFLAGLFASFLLETPTGATVVVVNIIVLAVFALIGRVSRK